MLTRSKSRRGEGSLAKFIYEIERVFRKKRMASEGGTSPRTKKFEEAFFSMSKMVKVLYDDFLERKKLVLGELFMKGKGEGKG
jgi:hypothetical protein